MTATEDDIEPPLQAVPPTRRAILVALKRRGPLRAQDLATELDLTTAAVRQQLGRLEGDGLVRRTVLLVSHDRDFIDRVVTSVIATEGDGRWIEYAGGYSDMLRWYR